MSETTSFEQKVDRAVRELLARGVPPGVVNPPILRLFWRMGIHTPPLVFLSPRQAATLMLSVLVPFLTVVVQLWSTVIHHPSPWLWVDSLAIGGAVSLLGTAFKTYLIHVTQRLVTIPAWRDYGAAATSITRYGEGVP